MTTNLAYMVGSSQEETAASHALPEHSCLSEVNGECFCTKTCASVGSPVFAHPLHHGSDHSSSDCQWSTEERILQRLCETEGSKLDAAFFYSGVHDAPVLRSSYFYENYDYEYGFSHASMSHSPNVDRTFSRHHTKLGGDPTFLLTLIRWARIGSSRLLGDDDAIDRLNYQFTTLILLLLITLTGLRQYLSHLPLQCWIPQEFSRSWEEYAEHYCWVTNTYFSDVQARLPPPEERKNVVRYYQWATFVLGLQAAAFYLPCLIWRLLQNYSGFQVKRIMQSVIQVNCAPTTTVSRTVRGIAYYMDAVLYQRKYKYWQKLQHQCGKMKPNQRWVKHDTETQSTGTAKTTDAAKVRKSVQFQAHPDDTINGSECVSAGFNETSSETVSWSSRKKCRAPSPPAKVHISGSSSQQPSRRVGNSHSNESARRCTALCCASSLCSFCTQCKCNSQRNAKRKPRDSQSTLREIESSTGETTQPLIDDKRDGPPSGSTIKQSGSILCCARRKTPRQPTITSPLKPAKEKPVQVQIDKRTLKKKSAYRLLTNVVLFGGRLILTLLCLIPGCLCHCIRGTQKTKCVQRSNSFLFYLYVTIKLLYLFNLIAQLYFMKIFLDTESHFFGFYVLYDLLHGRMWTQTGNFPRVTYCDFEAKKPGKNYKYTLQCVLPLNLFLEKVYIFLWFWMIFVALMTTYSLLKWLSRLSIPQSRYRFIHKFLIPWKLPYGCEDMKRQILKMFVEQYLDLNGVFILWLTATNAGEVVAGELIAALWDLFQMRVNKTSACNKPWLFADYTDSMERPSGAFDSCMRNDAESCKRVPAPRQTKLTFVEGTSWKPTDVYVSNVIPPYCTMPKRRVHKPRAPDIPGHTFVSRASTPCTSSSTNYPSSVFRNPLGADRPVEEFAIDSSLDSIV